MNTRTNLMERDAGNPPRIAIIILVILAGLIGIIALILAGLLILSNAPLADSIPVLLGITDKTPWFLSRAAGTVAYLLLAGSTVWGLLLSTRIIKEAIPAALSMAMHNSLSWLALVFTGLHGFVLLFDHFYTYTLFNLVIPLTGPYRPGWVGLGIAGSYLMLILVLSFQFRKRLGQKRWRLLHYLSFLIFVMATIHGAASGTDSGRPGMQAMYLGSGLLVFFLTSYRLLTRHSPSLRKQQSSI